MSGGAAGALEAGDDAIDMLMEVIVDLLPEGVQQEFHAFAACDFGCRDKVAVAGDKDDGIDLLLESEGGDVDSDAHVHTLLSEGEPDIVGGQIPPGIGEVFQAGEVVGTKGWGGATGGLPGCLIEEVNPIACSKQFFGDGGILDAPSVLSRHFPKAEGEFPLAAQRAEKLVSEDGFGSLGKLDLLIEDRMMGHLIKGGGIIVEEAIDMIKPAAFAGISMLASESADVVSAKNPG